MTRFWKLAINAFILAHLATLTLWNMPSSALRDRLLHPSIAPYLSWTGLRQYWGMFAAGGATTNYRVEAEVTLQDGSQEIWKFPPVDEWGPLERVGKVMHVSWGAYVVDHREAWPETARYVARLHAREGKSPVQVALVMCSAPIAPPSGSYQPIARPDSYPQRSTLYTHQVVPEDLR